MHKSENMEVIFPTGESIKFFFVMTDYVELSANDGLELYFGAKTLAPTKKIGIMSVSHHENDV